MRKVHVVLVISAILLWAPSAWAQQRGRGFGGFGGGSALLGQESVQAELKLSPDQVKKLDEFLAKQRETFSGLRDLSQEERRQKFAEIGKESQAALNSILTEAQRDRLKQITLQQRGTEALADPGIAEAIGLDDDQKSRIQGFARSARDEMRSLFQGGGGGDRTEMRKKLQEARAALAEKINGVLSSEQQAKWKEMLGEPFKGEIRSRFRRGRRGDGDGANRRRRDSDDSRSTGLFERAAGPFRLASFRADDDDDDDPGDDDKKPEAKGKKKSDHKKPRAHRHHRPGHSKQAHARHRHGHRHFAGRPMSRRDWAWARVARAVGHPGARGPQMAHRGWGRHFADRGHHGPPHPWFAHRGGEGRGHGHRPPAFAAGRGFRGAGQRFWIAERSGFHGHGHMRGPGHHGHWPHHGPHGPMMAHHHRFHGHHDSRTGDHHDHHDHTMARGGDHHGPPPWAMAAVHRHGPPRSFSFAGHGPHHGHTHMAGFKRHRPHGHSFRAGHGDRHGGKAKAPHRSRSGDRDDDDRDDEDGEDRDDD